MTSTTAVIYSVTTLLSESLRNDGEKPNQPKKLLFPKCDRSNGKIFIQHAFSLALNKSGIINLYWKDGHFEKTGGFCKHKYSSLYSQALEVIYSSPRSGCGTWCSYLLSKLYRLCSEKACNRKYLLKVAQTVRYLARPGWPLKKIVMRMRLTAILPSFYYFMEMMIQR